MDKKNILFIGPYRQTDGWGLAAKDYVKALAETEHNLSIKPIYLSESIDQNISYDLLGHESNLLDKKPDVVIQNMLPTFMDYIHGSHNIGLLFLETNHVEHTGWIDKMNLLNEIWVASTREKLNLEESGIRVPVNIVPMPIDVSDFDRETKKPLKLPEVDSCFVFYFIGEYITRKNINEFVLAYHREFRNNEPVK